MPKIIPTAALVGRPLAGNQLARGTPTTFGLPGTQIAGQTNRHPTTEPLSGQVYPQKPRNRIRFATVDAPNKLVP